MDCLWEPTASLIVEDNKAVPNQTDAVSVEEDSSTVSSLYLKNMIYVRFGICKDIHDKSPLFSAALLDPVSF